MIAVKRGTEGRLVKIIKGYHKGEIGVCAGFSDADSGRVCYHIIFEHGSEDILDYKKEPKKFRPLAICNN